MWTYCLAASAVTVFFVVVFFVQWQKGLPIEVLPFAYKPVQLKLQAMGGSAELRIAKQKAVSGVYNM